VRSRGKAGWLRSGACAVLCAGCVLLVPGRGQSQEAPQLYERQRLERALQGRALAIDPRPEGKRIAFIKIAREEVFESDELIIPLLLPRFAPTWPNAFHWLTEEDVIRRELLIKVGDRYDSERVEESMRNLRELGVLALVRIVPVMTDDASSVGLFVYARDLWSLRLETAFAGTADSLDLSAQLTERNFLGRHKLLAARFAINPKSFSLGEAYIDPRVLGGELSLSQSFDLIFNRDSGDTEGSRGALSVSQPFRDLRQRWGWSAMASYLDYVYRPLLGSRIKSYRSDAQGRPDFCEQHEPECVRSVWDDQSQAASFTGSYRRGTNYKQTFSLGAAYSDREVRANAETQLMPGQEQVFQLLLPRTRRQVYPFFSYDVFVPRYVVLNNLSTFGKSENVRVGPELGASVSVPLRAFGSSTDSVRFTSDLGYVLAAGDALAEASLAVEARLEEGKVVDQRSSTLLRGATPQWLLGRLVLLGSWDARRHDTSQTQVTLGADNGMRGYENGSFPVVGGNRLRGNVEYRTLPLVVESVHLGTVLFYDLGSVYREIRDAELHHAIGAGLRLLFPQFNHTPFRLDFGVPLDSEGFTVQLSYGSEQAVPLTAADDASALAEF